MDPSLGDTKLVERKTYMYYSYGFIGISGSYQRQVVIVQEPENTKSGTIDRFLMEQVESLKGKILSLKNKYPS
jgi:hypothetical protein